MDFVLLMICFCLSIIAFRMMNRRRFVWSRERLPCRQSRPHSRCPPSRSWTSSLPNWWRNWIWRRRINRRCWVCRRRRNGKFIARERARWTRPMVRWCPVCHRHPNITSIDWRIWKLWVVTTNCKHRALYWYSLVVVYDIANSYDTRWIAQPRVKQQNRLAHNAVGCVENGVAYIGAQLCAALHRSAGHSWAAGHSAVVG